MPQDRAPAPYAQLSPAERAGRLRELAAVFTKLGTLAFGGPAAHVAMMDEEVVRRRGWLDRQRFLDLLAAANLIPGPSSTELAIYVGYNYGGWPGLLVAGACFIVPAMLLVWALSALYAHYQALPQATWLLYGIKPVIVAVVVHALWGLGKSALKNLPTTVAGAVALVLAFLGLSPLLLLVLSGLLVMLWQNGRPNGGASAPALLPLAGLLPGAAAAVAPTWAGLFWAFVKIGSVVYGSGYVLLVFLQKDLVEHLHWLTAQQLLDAVAVGQFTPGPVFTTATFIGYLVGGNAGALAATAGIFLPAFALVAIVNPWVPRLRKSPWAGAFLDGVTAASLALMATVTWSLGRAALTDWLTIVLALVSLGAILRYKVNSAWLVLAGGAIGVAVHLL